MKKSFEITVLSNAFVYTIKCAVTHFCNVNIRVR